MEVVDQAKPEPINLDIEMTSSEWEFAGPENGGSRVYPVPDQYQKKDSI